MAMSKRFISYYFFFLFRTCVKAEAATLLTALELLGLDSNFEALDATDLEVCSFFAFAFAIA